jgi:hypothetical protein
VSREDRRLFVPANVRAVVTRRGLVTRESESFGGRVSACERKPGGCTRTSTALARNRERWGRRRDSANLGKKATNAKRRGHRLSAFLGNSCVRFARYRTVQLPDQDSNLEQTGYTCPRVSTGSGLSHHPRPGGSPLCAGCTSGGWAGGCGALGGGLLGRLLTT